MNWKLFEIITQSSVTAQLDAIYLSISIGYTFRFLKDLCISRHMARKGEVAKEVKYVVIN